MFKPIHIETMEMYVILRNQKIFTTGTDRCILVVVKTETWVPSKKAHIGSGDYTEDRTGPYW